MASDTLQEPLKSLSDQTLEAHVNFFLLCQYARNASLPLEQRDFYLDTARYTLKNLEKQLQNCFGKTALLLLEAEQAQQGEQ